MDWKCMYSKYLRGWVVEGLLGDDREVHFAQFYGPNAEHMAQEYAAWKNQIREQPQLLHP